LESLGHLPCDAVWVVFTVDQAYRITNNRSLLQPITALADARSGSRNASGETLEIYCECSADTCTATLVVRRSDYERLRPERRQLLVALGHETDAPVYVRLRTETYELVEPLTF
jgi:hypothetical protein